MAKDLMATQTGGVDTSTSPDVSQQNTQTQDLSPKEKKESTEAADLGIPADVKPSASSFELPSSRQNFTDEAIKNAIPETKIEEPKQQDPSNQQLIANSAPAKVLGIQPTEAPQNTTESTLDKELESKQDIPADVVTQEDEQNKSILKELGINANFSKNAYGSLSEDPTNLRIDLDSYSGVDYLPDAEESDYDSEEIVSDFTKDENGFPIVDDNYDLAKSNLELKGRGVRLDNKGALIDVDETEDGEPKPDGFYSLGGRQYQKLDGNWLVKVNGKFSPLSSGDVERRKMTLESSAVMSKQPKKIIQETIEFAGIPIDAETRRRDANNIFQQKKSKDFSEQAIGDYTSRFQEGGEYSNIFKEAGIENPLPDGTYKYPGKQNVEYLKKDGAWYINNNPTGKGKGKDEFVPLTYGVKDRIISLERTARLKGAAEEETKASQQVKKNVEQALNTSFNEVSDVVSAYTQAGQSIYSFVKNLADKYNVSDEAFNIALKKAANGTLAESDEQVLQSFGSFYNDLEDMRLPVRTGGEFDLSRLFEYNMASPFEKYNLDGTLNPMFNESLFNEYNNTLEGKVSQLKQDAPLSVMNVGNQWDAIAKGSAAAKMNVQLGKIKAPGFYKAGNEVFRADGYGRWFDDDGNPVNDASLIAALNTNGTENLTSNMHLLVNGSERFDVSPNQFPVVSKLIKTTNIYKLIKSDEQLQAYLNSVLLDAKENKYKLGADFESKTRAYLGKPITYPVVFSGLQSSVLNTESELNSLPIIEMLLDYDTTPEYWEKYQSEEGSLDVRDASMGVANSFINKAISEFYATKESELKARNFVSHNLNNLSAVLTADQLEGLKSYQNFMKTRLEEMDNNLTRSTEAFREFKQKANEINNTISSDEMRALNSAPAKERKGIFKKIKKRQENEVKALKEETLADVSASQFVSKDLSQTMSNAQTYVEEAKNINYYLKDLQNKGININQDLYQKKTETLNQIPILGSTNSLNYGTSTEGDQLNTAMSLFKETRDMTDYMLTQVGDGNLIIQPDGSFDFALKGVTEEEVATIQATLDRYNQNINKYLSEKEIANKQERAEISSKIKNTNLDISNLSDRLRKSTSTEEISKLKKGIDELTNNKYNLERDLQQKREESSAVLLTDAPFLVGRVVSNAPVDLSKTILSAIPKDANLSPKNKFDLYFNGLVKELNKAKENANIDHSRLERASMKIRDMLDWNTIGLSLTKEEKEYLQLLTTVKQLMPLYMNNAASFSKESQGFFESFNQGMMNSFFPTTSKALGGSFMGTDMRNEREAANVYMKVLNDIGLTEEDLNPTAVQEIAERGKETDLSDLEFWGQQAGLTSAIMYSFATTRNVYKTGFDALKRTEKLLTGVTGLTKSEQVYMGISNTYDKLMDMNATTRFLKVPMAYGVQFEQAGQLVGAQEKELTFTAGLIGGMFAEGFAAAAKNFTPQQVKSYISGVFQENAPRVFKAIENASRVTGFGVGETAQELGEEMAHAWEESENGKNFYDVLEEKFGTFDKASKFFVSTFVMGAAFGLGTNSQRAKKAYDALPENMRQRVDQAIQMYQREMSAVQSAMDEYLSENIENDVRSSVAEVITQEQTTTRNDKKDKQGVSGEVREGQESVQAEPIEGASTQEAGDGGVVQGKQGQAKIAPSGFNPSDNLIQNPELLNNTTHGWRVMSENEFQSLSNGDKTYEGGAPKGGNWISGVPSSAAQFGGKGKVMVEFGGIDIAGGENMSEGSTADRSNVTKVWKFNDSTGNFEEAPELLETIQSQQKTESPINEEVNSLLEDLKDLNDPFGVIYTLTNSDGDINVDELLNLYNDKSVALDDVLSLSQQEIIKKIQQYKNKEKASTEEERTLGEQTPVIESERVTLNNTTSPENPSQISYSIDVDGSSVGEVTGRYDSKGNFVIDDISVSEGEQGKEIASETIDAISNETGGKVIISADSDNAARVGESFEKKGNATRNENGDFVVEPIQEVTQEEEVQQEPTEEKPLEEREPKSVADKLRRLKIKRTKGDGGITLYAGLPVDPMREGFKAAWNGAIETLATVIEKGGTAITNVKEALKQSKIRFQNSDFYQNLQTREEKSEQMSLFLEAVQNELQDKRIIEQEELTNKAITSAEKKFKESEWYKNLDLKGKRNAMKQFREAMRQEAESKSQRMSAEERQKAKEFGERVDEVTGVTKPNPIQRIKERELIARSMKDRSRGAKDLRGLIKEATDYANTHLPKDEYSKREVSSLLKKIAKVKDVNSLDKVLGEVDALISKKEDNFRKNSAKETQKRIQDIKRGKEITSKKGNKRVGSIDIEARKELEDFLKSINVEDMSNRSLEEIQAINDVIDGIIETGKADKSAVDKAKKASERAERAKIMTGWRTSKDHKLNVNGVSEILEHLNQPGATVIVDGQLMGKSDFKEWLNRKKKDFKESKKPSTTPTASTTPTTPTGPTMSPEEEKSLSDELEQMNSYISSSQEEIDKLEKLKKEEERAVSFYESNIDFYEGQIDGLESKLFLNSSEKSKLKKFKEDLKEEKQKNEKSKEKLKSIQQSIDYTKEGISTYQSRVDEIQAQLDNSAKPKEDIFEETQTEAFNRIKKMKKGSPEQQQAINEFNSKFGDAYERMSKIDSKFASIVSALESNKLIEKDC